MSCTLTVTCGAEISECGKYRYTLTRTWDDTAHLLWIMLNPSTADASIDDPTIRRCMGFARSWNYGGIEVVNLFAYRATDPKELVGLHPNVAQGPDNANAVAGALMRAGALGSAAVAAWGAGYRKCKQARLDVEGMASEFAVPLYCLGVTKQGDPRHPLYVPNTQRAIEWPIADSPNYPQGSE